MAYRYSNTDKWKDAWFVSLKPLEKLLFNYLCDNCDIAGFIEIVKKNWASDIGCQVNQIEGALKGLERGLIYSKTNDCVYLRTFLKHQKNLPLNESNMCHKGIMERFKLYKYKFEIDDVNEFVEGALEGLIRGYGNGSGIGLGNYSSLGEENRLDIITWRDDFNIYKKELEEAYNKLISNSKYIDGRKSFHPGLDILKSLNKAYTDYWSQKEGWLKKKSVRKTETINWESTFNNALTMKMNQVWLPRDPNQATTIKPKQNTVFDTNGNPI